MPNILDIRRRIRSVTNTRQITKAMKMVSAAKLRRTQERALAARPYAQMLANVLKSLVSRAEIYDPETGEPRHPLLARRPENKCFADRGHRRQGFGGSFQYQHFESGNAFYRNRNRTRISKLKPSAARGAISCGGVFALLSPVRRSRVRGNKGCRIAGIKANHHRGRADWNLQQD